MRMQEEQPKPGWYQVDQFTLRYWDGELWTDRTTPRPFSQAEQRAMIPRRWYQRRWGRSLIGLGALLVIGLIGSGIEEERRSNTELGSEQSGSQQEWIDYFERSNELIGRMNDVAESEFTASGLDAMTAALELLRGSPDPALNRTIEEAILTCNANMPAECMAAYGEAADQYNAALEEAADDGLLDIKP